MKNRTQAGDYVRSAKGHAEEAADDILSAAGSAFGDARDAAEETADDLHRRTDGAYAFAKDKAKSAYDDVHDAGERYYRDAKTVAGQSASSVETYVRNNPVSSIFAALGVGFVVGLVTRK
jgi:ElaB/YqjD/DUF883 family membrane-anchored ribosome-binding protein